MRTDFTQSLTICIALLITGVAHAAEPRPNILFCIADDWGVHAGAYGDKVVKTPTFDRLASDGVVFEHAYVSAPSCTPSRAAILTGQWHWRLGSGANLYGSLAQSIPVYTDLLEADGYFVGYTRKGWAPGQNGERPRNPAGDKFKNFATFLKQRPADQPFCFWFGSTDPHRSYRKGSGAESGIPLDKIELSPNFPDSMEVRSDVADYYFEVQRFDRETGEHIKKVRALGELDNTIIVMTSDHGMPFPRAKSNIYDEGARVPLAIHWPGHYEGGHRVQDFVSTTEFAPTFLEVAGLAIPDVMTGRSLTPLLTAGEGGWIDPTRTHVLFGKERHVPSQVGADSGGYPCRAIRNDDFLLIHNFEPDRWPVGTRDYKNAHIKNSWLGDTDNGPTKSEMVKNEKQDAEHQRLYDLSFGKRPEFELYDVAKDPAQHHNLAANPEYAAVLKNLSQQLEGELRATQDPRVVGGGEMFDQFPYSGGAPKFPAPETSKTKSLQKDAIAK
ncbi:sulfatase family protein [Neorhodopirellula lusitana]|uniref:sulfatase family protein n=1 Tax=Neorhodopirellula lusitana TaxID=445327 RepID=UPI00384F851A